LAASGPSRAAWPVESDLLAGIPVRGEILTSGGKLADLATPLALGGFTRGAIERFAGQLRGLGLEPLQGASAGGPLPAKLGDPALVEPGSMISVQLVTGDFQVGADGTVTHIDGDRVWAFGHRFLSVGGTDLPFARASVLALLPSVSSSFKISAARELMGVISSDRNAAVSGRLGQRAALVPVDIRVGASRYRMEMVRDRFLTPFLLQITLYSAIDATERITGSGSFSLTGRIEFTGAADPVRFDTMFAADAGAAVQAALHAAIPTAYALQSGFPALGLKRISIDVTPHEEKRVLQIEQVHAGRPTARPGETVDLTVTLAGESGSMETRRVRFNVPIGIPAGPLYFTASDAQTRNLAELRPAFSSPPRSAERVVSALNSLGGNRRGYVRVWRADASFQVRGEEYPSPPPSLAMILTRAGATQAAQSKLAEFEIDGGGWVIAGSKT
ncbi:MAG: hypothetical protein ACRD96_13960, partial [Bryobacteraceae bacterium]